MPQSSSLVTWQKVYFGFAQPSQESRFREMKWLQQCRRLAGIQVIYALSVLFFFTQTGLLQAWWVVADWQATGALACWLFIQVILGWFGQQLLSVKEVSAFVLAMFCQHCLLLCLLLFNHSVLVLPFWLIFSLPVLLTAIYIPIVLAHSMISIAGGFVVYTDFQASSLHLGQWAYSILSTMGLVYVLLLVGIFLLHKLWRNQYIAEQGLQLFSEQYFARAADDESLSPVVDVDPVTGLANETCFKRFSETEIERSSRYQNAYSVILIKINHFFNYQDTLGQEEADKLLINMVNLLHPKIRKVDLIARYQQDKFVIGLPETSLYQALDTAERMQTALSTEFWSRFAEDLQLETRFGVACIDSSVMTVEQLLMKAEHAMNNHRSPVALSYGR
ncbi:diguanylate cyclase domain-containing protein [Agarivorans sp. QJM3NY_29]|uniref:GGDEF domain-containing protein n=1 Tax=unclassified Agarivorans TaxID=2636026 RepID=UPI003D7D8619